ncbi:MAG: DUF2288 domain-containing protein [Okeania sp. SIO2G4]|uniref:DUF2288 domain-containing protein n=1 Tax=unclassified Okeania TaxID=2634635 RepID=UPI0013BA1585|nr:MULTISPECIES: DUF2288 domain-containing protein [unclassified Okeania]NEP03972.1 DUF2288 domain-containing protein [Okeania sp. SIO4D6]NEP37885.1 DUF2288 domain-containing protein [Okeania sp. SIO2H7]NEP71321.1 DUF2288 domain-containing protein [Okeania sp. SIO2G5]NEP91985.1 DUF2288 domain-containing protein [Okeania sp. SIO2F5]NEQ89462.1 DUF2288 domain-containing protein [Okeania sp. SIO2G4]
MQDIREQLAENLDVAEWNWLVPHVKRDAVVIVGKNLDLLDVGVAIASDNISSVQDWISRELIYKPSAEQLSIWNSNDSKKFNALIVQPFVLVQESDATQEDNGATSPAPV